jgi:type IV secretory pathway ATPase VirB11/archaellum biosynthesis ATPase
VFLTDITELIDNENFLRNIKILSRKHLCLIFSIVNKHSEPFFSGDQPITEDMLSDKLASHINWENIVITKQKLYNIGVNFKVISADKLNSALLNEYIQIKKRQIL